MTKEEQFEAFWRAYPRRVSKGTARTAFDKALRKTTLSVMLAAITDYVRNKPDWVDFKHPATWLNGECWDDEWPAQQTRSTDRLSAAQNLIARINDQGRADSGNSGDYGHVQLIPSAARH